MAERAVTLPRLGSVSKNDIRIYNSSILFKGIVHASVKNCTLVRSQSDGDDSGTNTTPHINSNNCWQTSLCGLFEGCTGGGGS